MKHRTDQQGFVAIFSVMFFALLSTVITVGFIRIMIIEQRQALDNDLTARALSAAEGGVDDAKRAILYYSQMPTGTATDIANKAAFRSALNNAACDSLTSSSLVQGATGIKSSGEISSEDTGLNMFYKCLTVKLDTPDFEQNIAQDDTVVVPLKTDEELSKLVLKWHLVSQTEGQNSNGPITGYPANGYTKDSLLPDTNAFLATSPAYLRVQLVGVPKTGAITREILENRSRTIFLLPASTNGTTTLGQPFENDGRAFQFPGTRFYKGDAGAIDNRKQITNKVACVAPVNGQYACSVELTLPSSGDLDMTNNDYQLRITSLYRKSRVLINGLENLAGSPINFVEAQPSIDSTGVAADVFRRIQVRTNFPGDDLSAPRYGVEVGQSLCKNFAVSEVEDYPSACTP